MKLKGILKVALLLPLAALHAAEKPDVLAEPRVVQKAKGYNSWPMIQALGDKLVCVYSRGSGHTIGEDARTVYARTSLEGGKTWTAETVVANTPGYGDV
ncbi:MAG: hypothetical protein NTY53_10865, partial [Kiritimatiellaeota bacterium]|nr:hypothetical protein [Kiritimatiellota bacterium]